MFESQSKELMHSRGVDSIRVEYHKQRLWNRSRIPLTSGKSIIAEKIIMPSTAVVIKAILQSLTLLIFLLGTCLPACTQSETIHKEIQGSKQGDERNSQSTAWRIGIKEAPPFSFKDNNGNWVGLSVRLWQWIAEDVGFTYEYEEYDLQGILKGLRHGNLDAAVGALTINAERETFLDFSHTFFISGIGVAVKKKPNKGFFARLGKIMRGVGPRTIGVIMISLAVITILIFLFERRYAKDKPDKAHRARNTIRSSLWWSLVILIGKNERHPISPGGRIMALSWMVLAMIIFSSLTALITSALTVSELQNQIHSPDDLVRARLVTVKSSTSETFLNRERLDFRSVATIQDGFKLLAEGTVDFIVFDRPMLRYLVKKNYPGQFEVLNFSLEQQQYGFAVKEGTQQLEAINHSLLTRMQSSIWNELVNYYLGKKKNSL